MAKKLTTEEFVQRARKVHGNKYDYSKVEYLNNRTKVCIICPKHGEFWQTPDSHMSGNKCPKCSGTKKLTTEEFIEQARKIHGNKYDYSKVEYINNHSKVCIICPEHGEFWQTPINHCSKNNHNGCPICAKTIIGNKLRKNNSCFIEKAREIHGDKYDYSKVEYINNRTKVCIICPKHGEFWQTPVNHLKGHNCPKCIGRGAYKLTTEEFIEKAKQIHGDKYDYSKVKYVNAKTKVCIICPEHGEFWQTPTSHIDGKCGCPDCNKLFNEKKIGVFLNENGIRYIKQKTFKWLGKLRLDYYLVDYNIAIEYQGEQHFHSVKYFGGNKRFIDRIERDKRKKELCDKNNVKILYVSFYKKPTYDVINNFKDLLYEIQRNIYRKL